MPDLSELMRYGWILVWGVVTWFFKDAIRDHREKMKTIETNHKILDEKVDVNNKMVKEKHSELSEKLVRIENTKLSRDDLDQYLNALEKKFDSIDRKFDINRVEQRQMIDDLKEFIKISNNSKN